VYDCYCTERLCVYGMATLKAKELLPVAMPQLIWLLSTARVTQLGTPRVPLWVKTLLGLKGDLVLVRGSKLMPKTSLVLVVRAQRTVACESPVGSFGEVQLRLPVQFPEGEGPRICAEPARAWVTGLKAIATSLLLVAVPSTTAQMTSPVPSKTVAQFGLPRNGPVDRMLSGAVDDDEGALNPVPGSKAKPTMLLPSAMAHAATLFLLSAATVKSVVQLGLPVATNGNGNDSRPVEEPLRGSNSATKNELVEAVGNIVLTPQITSPSFPLVQLGLLTSDPSLIARSSTSKNVGELDCVGG
jgi:hypothetical protein